MNPDPTAIGRYQVQSLLGRGGMGAVYLAFDPLLKRQVVIKVVHEKGASYDHALERFQREAEISAKLNHPNVITIHDVGSDTAMGPFIAMEYVKGQSLAAMIRSEGLPPVDQVLRTIAQVSRALHAAALEGIVHRDVKPENILVSQEGRVKLTDFGIARFGESMLTTVGGVVGTPSYMAPELLRDAVATSVTDCYALAVTAFESITGELPFKGESVASMLLRIVHDPPAIPKSLSPALATVFYRAFEKAPEHRYPDVNAFTGALIHAVPLGSSIRTKLLLMLAGEDVSLHGFVSVSTNQWALPEGSGTPPSSPSQTPPPYRRSTPMSSPVTALPSEPDSSAPTALAPPVHRTTRPAVPMPPPPDSVFEEAPMRPARSSNLGLAVVAAGLFGIFALGLIGAGTWVMKRRGAPAPAAATPAPSGPAEATPASAGATPGNAVPIPDASAPAPATPATSPVDKGPVDKGTAELQEELRKLQAANAREEARLKNAGKPVAGRPTTPGSGPVATVTTPAAPAPAPAPSTLTPTPELPRNQLVQVLLQAPAVYPSQASGNPVFLLREPRVKVRVFVNENGVPLQVMVVDGVGKAGFDEAAISAARRSRFSPAIQGGKPVGAWIEMTFIFRASR